MQRPRLGELRRFRNVVIDSISLLQLSSGVKDETLHLNCLLFVPLLPFTNKDYEGYPMFSGQI